MRKVFSRLADVAMVMLLIGFLVASTAMVPGAVAKECDVGEGQEFIVFADNADPPEVTYLGGIPESVVYEVYQDFRKWFRVPAFKDGSASFTFFVSDRGKYVDACCEFDYELPKEKYARGYSGGSAIPSGWIRDSYAGLLGKLKITTAMNGFTKLDFCLCNGKICCAAVKFRKWPGSKAASRERLWGF